MNTQLPRAVELKQHRKAGVMIGIANSLAVLILRKSNSQARPPSPERLAHHHSLKNLAPLVARLQRKQPLSASKSRPELERVLKLMKRLVKQPLRRVIQHYNAGRQPSLLLN
jgi:hypothetical protein